MTAQHFQCLACGYLLEGPEALCPICHPGEEVPEHVKDQWADAHTRGIILYLGEDGAVVRESAAWEETGLLEEDVRPMLLRMEADGEIERFGGHYRVLRHPDTSP